MKARQIEQSAVAHMPPCTREVWDYLLANANHVDRKYLGFTIKRGQLFRSYSEIREALHWMIGWRKMTYNESQMKRAMKNLREALMIDTQKEPRGVLITVLNYGAYQNPKNYEETKESATERSIDEPLTNHSRPSINKNVKNYKNVKNKELTNNMSEKDFEQFWSAYPRKNNKKKAKDKFMRLKKDLLDQILNAVEKQKLSDQWQRGIVPHPTTWLNGERWEDELQTQKNNVQFGAFI